MLSAQASVDGSYWVGMELQEGGLLLKMQNYIKFFCLAQCPKVIYVECVAAIWFCLGAASTWAAVALPSKHSTSEKRHDRGPSPCFQWMNCGETIPLEGACSPKAGFPVTELLEMRRAKLKCVAFLKLLYPTHCSI